MNDIQKGILEDLIIACANNFILGKEETENMLNLLNQKENE